MLIRDATGGKKSLDDFAKLFFGGREGDWGEVVYDFDDVAAALNKVYLYDWAGFLRTRLHQPGAPPPGGGTQKAGYRLVWRDTPTPSYKGRLELCESSYLPHELDLPLEQAGV